jgi:hypothetical protein
MLTVAVETVGSSKISLPLPTRVSVKMISPIHVRLTSNMIPSTTEAFHEEIS